MEYSFKENLMKGNKAGKIKDERLICN